MSTKLDIIEGHELVEEFGIVTYLTRRAFIKGYTASSTSQLFAALGDAGLPLPGSTHPDDNNLILGPRHAIPKGNGYAFVDLRYRTKLGIFRGSSQVNQITTQTYRKGGGPILLTYTGSRGAAEDGSVALNPQVQTINPFSCERALFVEVLKPIFFPWVLQDYYVNTLNSTTWRSFPAKSVLCTQANFEPWVATGSNPWFIFAVEFHRRDLLPPFTNAWNPEVAWQRTDGTYPDDASVANGGIAMVDHYDTRDFNVEW